MMDHWVESTLLCVVVHLHVVTEAAYCSPLKVEQSWWVCGHTVCYLQVAIAISVSCWEGRDEDFCAVCLFTVNSEQAAFGKLWWVVIDVTNGNCHSCSALSRGGKTKAESIFFSEVAVKSWVARKTHACWGWLKTLVHSKIDCWMLQQPEVAFISKWTYNETCSRLKIIFTLG